MTMQTFFAQIASTNPILINGSLVYAGVPSVRTQDYIRFSNDTTLGLLPCGALDDLIRVQASANRDHLYKVKKNFIESKAKVNYETDEKRRDDITERKIFSFIIKELMPHLSGHKEDISDLLAEEVKRYEKDDKKPAVDEKKLDEALKMVKGTLLKEQEEYGRKNFEGITQGAPYINRLMTNQDIFVINSQIYRLEYREQEKDAVGITLNGETRFAKPKQHASIREIDQRLIDFFEWNARIEAIEEYSDYIKQFQATRLEAVKDFDTITRLKEFSDGDIGFLREGNNIYVYQIVTPFAMLDPRPGNEEICYEFPKMRVGMSVSYSTDRGRISLGNPCLIDPVYLPFVEKANASFQKLCGGHIPDRGGYTEVEWASKALDDAKNLVTNGLTPASIKGHTNETYFGTPLNRILSPRQITITEAKKKGLPLTNKWDWRRD